MVYALSTKPVPHGNGKGKLKGKSMKTLVKFNSALAEMLKAEDYNVEQLVNACQSAMNDAQGIEGAAKRGAVKGGLNYKTDGTLAIKDMKWTETLPIEYTAKQTAPIEFVKFNDSLERLFKVCGNPSGELSLGLVPAYLRDWIGKFHKNYVKPAPAKARNGDVKSVETPAPAGAAK